MRDADYRQKTAHAAELTRAAEQELQQLRQERETRVNQLDALANVLYQELVVDQRQLQALLDSGDTRGYLNVKEGIEQKQRLIGQAMEQRQLHAQQAEAESKQDYQRYLAEEQRKLSEKLPEWRDPKVREADTRAIADYLMQMGYETEELDALSDHRAMLIVRDAARYRAQQAMKQKQTAAPPAKTVAPGTRNGASTKQDADVSALKAKARRTHSDSDILNYLNQR